MFGNLRGIGWVAGVYFYFLIFAQFSFIAVLEQRGFAAESLRIVMGSMAVGGIAGSFLAMILCRKVSWLKLLKSSSLACSIMPILVAVGASTWSQSAFVVIALGIGLSLGALTVLISANLPNIMRNPYMGAGVGTGIAYMLSNIPWVFSSSPTTQCYVTGAMIFGVTLIRLKPIENPVEDQNPIKLSYFPLGLLWFTILVWLDSAAFFIIQHNQEMKLVTWGDAYLWRNAVIHLLAAVFSGWLILKHKLVLVLVTAFILLGSAGLMVSHIQLREYAGILYPIGVSFYSVGLILYPAVWLKNLGKTKRAVILLAVAGWIGSALGIGMAQDLREVPAWFVCTAGILMVAGYHWRWILLRKRELISCSAVLSICFAFEYFTKEEKQTETSDLISRGREVYISEGCIHCHSRYVRPNSSDVVLWGPITNLESVTREQPVLIGNRRQGPDLINVGLRRSKNWLKLHFINPRSVVSSSTMPSYAHLFDDGRGDALVAYLSNYEPDVMEERLNIIRKWSPDQQSRTASEEGGKHLFNLHCAMCHGSEGKGDGMLRTSNQISWNRPPANLVEGPFLFTQMTDDPGSIDRVIKFGIVGTDMPGHELLSDGEISDLASYVKSLRIKLTK